MIKKENKQVHLKLEIFIESNESFKTKPQTTFQTKK